MNSKSKNPLEYGPKCERREDFKESKRTIEGCVTEQHEKGRKWL